MIPGPSPKGMRAPRPSLGRSTSALAAALCRRPAPARVAAFAAPRPALARTAAVFAALLLTLTVPPASARSGTGPDSPVVRTDRGWVRGKAAHDGGRVFQGTPFAAPPTGELRWRPPRPAARWSGTRDATAPAHPCPQLPLTLLPDGGPVLPGESKPRRIRPPTWRTPPSAPTSGSPARHGPTAVCTGAVPPSTPMSSTTRRHHRSSRHCTRRRAPSTPPNWPISSRRTYWRP